MYLVEDFQSKSFMGKYKETFLEVVDALAIRMKLQIDEVIPEGLSYRMDNTSNNEAREMLYVHLHSHATSDVIHKLCDAMTSKSGFPRMNNLGHKMKSDKDLPPYSMLTVKVFNAHLIAEVNCIIKYTVMHAYICTFKYIHIHSKHTHTFTCAHTNTHTHTHTHTHTRTHTHTHVYTHTHTHTHTLHVAYSQVF